MNKWQVELSAGALRDLRKLAPGESTRILDFLKKRLESREDPRSLGQPLKGSRLGEFWRYRVGDYRIIARIEDRKVIILVLTIGHRKEVYD